jgi:hypothetical protein
VNASITSELHAAMDQRVLESREIFSAERGYKEAKPSPKVVFSSKNGRFDLKCFYIGISLPKT